MIQVIPVVLCGGAGTRLWPLSRENFPKQFISFIDSDYTLFQQSLKRLCLLETNDIEISSALAVGAESQKDLVWQQVKKISEIKNLKIILEPLAKNTAPAITLAAHQALQDYPNQNPILVAAPSDQTIVHHEIFIKSLQKAIRVAAQNNFIILGIPPTYPADCYGYIHYQEKNLNQAVDVLSFQEKPSKEVATQYLQDGSYVWNSGIFVAPAFLWLEALSYFNPQIAMPVKKSFEQRTVEQIFIYPQKESFAKSDSDSVDYAVLEKCADSRFSLKMIFLEAGWNDLGSWDAVWQVGAKDQYGNVLKGNIRYTDTHNTLVYAQNRMVGMVGVNNLVVVETADAVLVADQKKSQEVKKIVQELKKENKEEAVSHYKVPFSWGSSEILDNSKHCSVKKIIVNSRGQFHFQNNQTSHWLVIQGKAEIICNQQVNLLKENQMLLIKEKASCRLKNLSNKDLEIIQIENKILFNIS